MYVHLEGDLMETTEPRRMSLGVVQDSPLDVEAWSDHGQESFHPDVGEFWLPSHALVSGNWSEFEDLRALSEWMDAHGLEVMKTPRYGDKAVVVPQ